MPICRYLNSSGTHLYPSEGGWPDGTGSFLLQSAYAGLWQHLRSNYGYTAGVDMFAAPYDWRMDYDGLEQVRGSLNFVACLAVLCETSAAGGGVAAAVHCRTLFSRCGMFCCAERLEDDQDGQEQVGGMASAA